MATPTLLDDNYSLNDIDLIDYPYDGNFIDEPLNDVNISNSSYDINSNNSSNTDYILDYPNPDYSNSEILVPKKYSPNINSEKINNSFEKYKEEIINLFDKYKIKNNNQNNKIKNWYNDLEKNVLDIFNDLQGKQKSALYYNDISKPKFELNREALNTTKTYKLDLEKSGINLNDPTSALNILKPLIIEKLKENPNTKQQLTVEGLMEKRNPVTGEITKIKAYFHSRYQEVFERSNYNQIFKVLKYKVKLSFETFIVGSSIWKFSATNMIFIQVFKINPLNGANHFPTPKFLASKNAIINPQNDDQKCLLWCVAINELLKTNPDLKNPGRITKKLKEKVNSFNIKGMEFPCGFSDIDKFEKNNNIPINLFGYDKERNHEIFPLRASKLGLRPDNINVNKHVNILLITNENEPTSDIEQSSQAMKSQSEAGKHYCLIKNMSRLLSNQVSKTKEKIHICNYCLQNFRNEKFLEEHLEYCSKYKCGKTVYRNKGEKLKFKNYKKMHNVPFVIYADFECNLKFVDKNIGDNTKQFQKHEPSGFCYLIKCFDDNLYQPKLVMYTKNEKETSTVSSKFVEMLENDIRKIHNLNFQKE